MVSARSREASPRTTAAAGFTRRNQRPIANLRTRPLPATRLQSGAPWRGRPRPVPTSSGDGRRLRPRPRRRARRRPPVERPCTPPSEQTRSPAAPARRAARAAGPATPCRPQHLRPLLARQRATLLDREGEPAAGAQRRGDRGQQLRLVAGTRAASPAAAPRRTAPGTAAGPGDLEPAGRSPAARSRVHPTAPGRGPGRGSRSRLGRDQAARSATPQHRSSTESPGPIPAR